MTEYPGSGGYGGPNPVGAGDPWKNQAPAPQWGQPAPAAPDEATAWGPYQPPGQPQSQPQQYAAPHNTPPPMYTGGGFPPPQPPRPNRTALWVTLGAGAAVLVVVMLVVTIMAFSGSSKKSGSAGEMVQAYLEALAAGDAEAALSFSDDQPASKELLTDEILQQQIEEMPITNIRILNDDSSMGYGSVHVTVNFGDELSDVSLVVTTNDDGEWKLDSAAVRVDNTLGSSDESAASTLTAFGKPVGNSVFYAFPGYIEWGSDNENIEVTSGKPLMLDSLGVGGYTSMSDIKYQLSNTGEQAIRDALQEALDACAQSTALQPQGCPQYLIQFDAVDGTVAWKAPSADGANITFWDYSMSAMIDMDASWDYTVRVEGGATESGSEPTYLSGEVDLNSDPLEVSLN